MNIPLLSYTGSKFQMAPRIIANIPQEHTVYTEAYLGSGAVFFQKRPSHHEVLNDKSGDVVNFMRILRDHKQELINKIALTPWAADEHALSLKPTSDPIEAARRFYFRIWSSIQPYAQSPGFRRQKKFSNGQTAAAKAFARIDHLYEYAERLRGVTIENMDALTFLVEYDGDNVIHYVDPPFPLEVRANKSADFYQVEMKTPEEHQALAKVLHSLKGMVVLSGYACNLYTSLFEERGWHREDMTVRINGGGQTIESLWFNPTLQHRLGAGQQMAML